MNHGPADPVQVPETRYQAAPGPFSVLRSVYMKPVLIFSGLYNRPWLKYWA